ncbi:MAG: 2-amino-4-hydroxy-6-hydroxymethyldihydropteridine diphosphokinase [Candidatus Kariarchaeaceae archaeon]|jgi:2-amino-4-hydroxy-6-hydroxymethyldihydropteridine diphosphokinase
MAEVYFSIGSNVGNRIKNLDESVKGLKGFIQDLNISYVYETEPWGFEDQAPFLNICVSGKTNLLPEQLLIKIKSLEVDIGRKNTFKWGPRVIDIDLLFYDDLSINKDNLKIPHLGIAERAFVLIPMLDLNPNYIHPVQKKSMSDIINKKNILT